MEATSNGSDAPKSPVHSLSSILSSESTKKLIHSLSMANVVSDKAPIEAVTQAPTTTSTATTTTVTPVLANPNSPGLVLPKVVESKKPIKFTVRKVSRDENVTIPGRASPQTRLYAYGNIPENRKQATERKNDSVLQQNQEKYDLYVKRLDKIDKEIEFLLNLLPPYNVEIDYATRNKITRAVEKLRMKRDEVEKKKYSLGMSISRMWREFDENETWVRSVSNH